MLPTKQLYVFYVLHQQVRFKSHVTREENLWRRAGSNATQRLACYTRRAQGALSAFLELVVQMLAGVRGGYEDSLLTSSNGSNQFLTANTQHPHYEDKTVTFLSSASAVVRKTDVFGGSNNGVACCDVSEEVAAAETCN